ncbi:hypothetical protein E2C01_084341 [Portunus trituberculatus]|uniref:Uncharacterized protein n=1 Tax=Portunus trituberculatus TaxID=210409 RepID=A0A5B7J620_PORTR|nr:hypothetical protein [Portunus trituberculatus]
MTLTGHGGSSTPRPGGDNHSPSLPPTLRPLQDLTSLRTHLHSLVAPYAHSPGSAVRTASLSSVPTTKVLKTRITTMTQSGLTIRPATLGWARHHRATWPPGVASKLREENYNIQQYTTES